MNLLKTIFVLILSVPAITVMAQTAEQSGSGWFNTSTIIGGVIGAIVGGLAGYYWNKRREP